MSAYEDFSAFKLFLLDTGLMGAMSGLPPQALLEGNALFSDYKGAITEQYVLQQLKSVKGLSIYYMVFGYIQRRTGFPFTKRC
mgnify:CR=1 FL=1